MCDIDEKGPKTQPIGTAGILPADPPEPAPTSNKSRHVSIRVSEELFDRLDAVATERGETVSHCARRLLDEGLTTRGAPAAVVDDAIATLLGVRGLLAETGPAREPATTPRVHEPPPSEAERQAPKTVNIHNAKTNLSRLLADVGRGSEIVIAHGGRARARLVPVDDADGGAPDNLG